MALIVFVKGINVGGHRSFRPSVLARGLSRLDVANVGAAGTFVVRKAVSRTSLREEIIRRLPFDAEVMICSHRDILRLASRDPFAGQAVAPDMVRFVSVLGKRRPAIARLPMDLPSSGDWCVRILGHHDRFVFGLYRREMRTIRFLEQLEKVFAAPVTTRNWNTILAIIRILGKP